MKLSEKAERLLDFSRKVQELDDAIENDALDLGFNRNVIDLRVDQRAFRPEQLAQNLCWDKSDVLKETLSPFVTLVVDDVCKDMIDQNRAVWFGLETADADMSAVSGDVSQLPPRTHWKPYDDDGLPDVMQIACFLDSAYESGSREAVRLMTRCAYLWLSHGMGYRKDSEGILHSEDGEEGLVFRVMRQEGTDDLWWKFEVEFLIQSALSGIHLCSQSIGQDAAFRLMEDCMALHKIVTASGNRVIDSNFLIGDSLYWTKINVTEKDVTYEFSEELSIYIQEFPLQ